MSLAFDYRKRPPPLAHSWVDPAGCCLFQARSEGGRRRTLGVCATGRAANDLLYHAPFHPEASGE